jgi:multiple sugar transport system substrate-binding protein
MIHSTKRAHRAAAGIGLLAAAALLLSGCSVTGAGSSTSNTEGDGTHCS